jgi:8-oxo-dGTP pyrophosphatase MutT (NUDIX family)
VRQGGGGHTARVDGDLDAATVVLLRDTAAGPECLMLHKNRGQAFGGAWVFPGGRVEPGDGSGDAGTRAAAVREVREETGLQIDAGRLVPLAHWSPPRNAPRRYLTWFFVTALPPGARDVVVDGGEIGDHVWTTPAAALDRHARGEIELLPPTWMTLRRLAPHADVAAALADAAAGPVERFATRIAQHDGMLVALWEQDVAYPPDDGPDALEAPATGVPLDAPGPRHRLTMDPAGWRYERTEES